MPGGALLATPRGRAPRVQGSCKQLPSKYFQDEDDDEHEMKGLAIGVKAQASSVVRPRLHRNHNRCPESYRAQIVLTPRESAQIWAVIPRTTAGSRGLRNARVSRVFATPFAFPFSRQFPGASRF